VRKSHALIAVTVLFVGIIGIAPAQAQASRASFTTTVPFEFTVGIRTLPAGTYTFEMVLGSPSQADQIGILVVRGLDRKHYVAQVTDVAQTIEASEKATAIFHRHGGRVFLCEVREKGKIAGLQLRPTVSEDESAQQSEEHEAITLLAVAASQRALGVERRSLSGEMTLYQDSPYESTTTRSNKRSSK
jgi:hypothetical protein